MLRHLGGVGVFILAALDSSVLPTLGAVDALTIVLAARHPELWSYYAMCSTRSAGLLSLTALLPPPFPTSAFVIGAGVTRYPFIAFVLSFGMGRMCRFALLAYLAPVFGRRFVTSLWSAHTLALVAAIGGVLVCIGLLAWLVFRKSEPHTPFGL